MDELRKLLQNTLLFFSLSLQIHPASLLKLLFSFFLHNLFQAEQLNLTLFPSLHHTRIPCQILLDLLNRQNYNIFQVLKFSFSILSIFVMVLYYFLLYLQDLSKFLLEYCHSLDGLTKMNRNCRLSLKQFLFAKLSYKLPQSYFFSFHKLYKMSETSVFCLPDFYL